MSLFSIKSILLKIKQFGDVCNLSLQKKKRKDNSKVVKRMKQGVV